MQKDYNLPPLVSARACNALEGGRGTSPATAQVPSDPFKIHPCFLGDHYYSANTIPGSTMDRLFRKFNGNLTQLGRNDSEIYYDSLRSHTTCASGAASMFSATIRLSKQIEKWVQRSVQQRLPEGPLFLDRPQVAQGDRGLLRLPFGTGKKWGAPCHGFTKRLISGWEATPST